MHKVDWREFYGEEIKPIPMEKYFLDDGRSLETRQMTYAFVDADQEGMEPTFEIDDVILHRRSLEPYVIVKIERFANEIYVESLDEKMKRSGKHIHFEEAEIYHKLKDVEWI